MSSERVTKAFKELVKKTVAVQCQAGEVISVDESEYTCEVKPADGGANYTGVRLKPVIDNDDKGVLLIPVVGSMVLIGVLMNGDDQAFVIQCSNVKRVAIKNDSGATFEIASDGTLILNGDNLGGIPIVQKIYNAINRIESHFNAHTHTANNTPTQLLIQPQTTQQELTNDKVKHGN